MSCPAPYRQALEDRWRIRLKNAELRLTFARNYVKEIRRDWSAPEIPAVDGQFALNRAVRAENVALKEYNRILEIYTNLTAKGVLPEEPV